MISGASEAHVQQADSFASVTLCHLPAHGGSNGTSAVRGEGSVTQRSFFLLTERPWPIANPALSEWIGGIEATFVGLRTDVEGISFAPALERYRPGSADGRRLVLATHPERRWNCYAMQISETVGW